MSDESTTHSLRESLIRVVEDLNDRERIAVAEQLALELQRPLAEYRWPWMDERPSYDVVLIAEPSTDEEIAARSRANVVPIKDWRERRSS